MILATFAHDDGAISHHSIRNKEDFSLFHKRYSELVAVRRDEGASFLSLPYACGERVWL